jgi:pimeloyl-ACP methyl ester carboxylesterase
MEYEEFGLLPENAADAGLPWAGPPSVRREFVTLPLEEASPGQPSPSEAAPGQRVSVLIWGEADPQIVLLYGGAQNAHTWDTVALALGRPLIAVDLPGHGRSSWRPDRDYWPTRNSGAVAAAVDAFAPRALAVVGMSLGGLTAIRLAAARPDLVRRLVMVDVTPGVTTEKSAPIAAFVRGPETFGSFDEMLDRTVRFNPSRSVSSLRRGLLHNAKPLPDGRWAWRYDQLRTPGDAPLDFAALWADLAAVTVPVMLACGTESGVVTDEDRTEFLRRRPDTRLELVESAGHSVQGDRPVELAVLIEDFVFGPA